MALLNLHPIHNNKKGRTKLRVYDTALPLLMSVIILLLLFVTTDVAGHIRAFSPFAPHISESQFNKCINLAQQFGFNQGLCAALEPMS